MSGAGHCAPRTTAEAALAERLRFGPEIRLACQTRVDGTGDVVVRRVVLDALDARLVATGDGEVPEAVPAGREAPATLLFADIAGYTAFADAHEPHDVAHVVARYFYVMGEAVAAYGGRISDYYGDGFLAVFGGDGHAGRGVVAAQALFGALALFNEYLDRLLRHRFEIRVGVHSGLVIAMTVGTEGMRKDAVIGDAVNVAARVEEANKRIGSRLLVTEAAIAGAVADGVNVVTSGMHRVRVRGKAVPLDLHEVGVSPV